MLLPQSLLNETVTVYRRTALGATPRDALNNPNYGGYTIGLNVIYTNVPVRLAFSDQKINFSFEAERNEPNGTMYYAPIYDLESEDRVITSTGIEYVVTAIRIGYLGGAVIDHYEAIVSLP